jgi:hypothetical protein
LNITFTRQSEHTYTTQVAREDGVTLNVPSHDRTFSMPHDLAHFVVERELGLKRGFWGCIAAGALFPGMKVLSGRQPPHAASRSQAVIREAGQQGTEAEVLVSGMLSIMHDGIENNWPAARAVVDRIWRPARPSRGPLEAEDVQRVCTALREAEQRWQALAVGESMTVSWTPERRGAR